MFFIKSKLSKQVSNYIVEGYEDIHNKVTYYASIVMLLQNYLHHVQKLYKTPRYFVVFHVYVYSARKIIQIYHYQLYRSCIAKYGLKFIKTN